MRGTLRLLAHGSQAASFLLGGIVLVGALAVAIVSRDVSVIAGWALDVLGIGFIVLLGSLIFLALLSLVRMHDTRAGEEARDIWLETGLQAANGVTTLALTFTLLGISLGIGSLAGQTLTPETVEEIIRDLTANFSLAFMTTVIGLPVSAALRAALSIADRRLVAAHPNERFIR